MRNHDSQFAVRLSRVGIVMLFAGALAACGGGGGDQGAPAPGPMPSPPPPGDLSTTITATTYGSGTARALVYQALNETRLSFGSGTVAQASELDSEAQAQADYIAQNYVQNDSFGGVEFNALALEALQPDGLESGHVMLQGLPGYVAYSPADRATHFGYPSTEVGEAATFPTDLPLAANQSADCVSGLETSPGHRELLLDPRFRDLGIGLHTLSQAFDNNGSGLFSFACYLAVGARASTYSASGLATAPADWVGLYPADGATVWSTGDGHGHGYAPSVTVDSHYSLTVTSFTITDPKGALVPVTLNADALVDAQFANWAFATPNAALATSTSYTVHFVGTANGTAIDKTWHFTTPAQ